MGRSPESFIQQSKRFSKEHPALTKVAIGVAVNKALSEIVWGGRGRSKIHMLPYESDIQPIAAGIAFPGMGNTGDCGEEMARRMSDTIPNQPWAYIKYDNSRKLKIEDIADLLNKYKKDTGATYLDIYPESMGTTIAIEAARIADIPIRLLYMNSPPFDLGDGYGGRLGEVAAKLPDTGVLGKFIGTFIADTIRPGGTEFVANLAHAGREAVSGGSIKLFKSKVKLLKSVKFMKNWKKYSRVINPDHTVAAYVAPIPENDHTVRVEQAGQKYEDFLGLFKVKLHRIDMPFAGHADTEAAIRIGRPWIQREIKSKEHLIFQRGSN